MIAAVTDQPITNGFKFGWFDVVLLAILAFGLVRGRRNGMSKELLPLLQWVTIVLLCGLVYPILGQLFANTLGLSKMWSYLAAYLVLMLAVLIPFTALRRKFTERMTQSDYFKSGEYYLGMISGMIRFGCMVIVALALINARFYTKQEIQQNQAFNERWFGGGLYGGSYFPGLHTVQEEIFEESASGHFIKYGTLGFLLINTTPAGSDKESAAPPKPQPVIRIGN